MRRSPRSSTWSSSSDAAAAARRGARRGRTSVVRAAVQSGGEPRPPLEIAHHGLAPVSQAALARSPRPELAVYPSATRRSFAMGHEVGAVARDLQARRHARRPADPGPGAARHGAPARPPRRPHPVRGHLQPRRRARARRRAAPRGRRGPHGRGQVVHAGQAAPHRRHRRAGLGRARRRRAARARGPGLHRPRVRLRRRRRLSRPVARDRRQRPGRRARRAGSPPGSTAAPPQLAGDLPDLRRLRRLPPALRLPVHRAAARPTRRAARVSTARRAPIDRDRGAPRRPAVPALLPGRPGRALRGAGLGRHAALGAAALPVVLPRRAGRRRSHAPRVPRHERRRSAARLRRDADRGARRRGADHRLRRPRARRRRRPRRALRRPARGRSKRSARAWSICSPTHRPSGAAPRSASRGRSTTCCPRSRPSSCPPTSARCATTAKRRRPTPRRPTPTPRPSEPTSSPQPCSPYATRRTLGLVRLRRFLCGEHHPPIPVTSKERS